MLKNVPYPVTF